MLFFLSGPVPLCTGNGGGEECIQTEVQADRGNTCDRGLAVPIVSHKC